ncbi:Secreted protein [Pseudomonas sp. IT-P294]|jgi:hypothetical protein
MGRTIRWVQTCIRLLQWGGVFMIVLIMIVPTLCVGMQPGTLCVPRADAERPLRHSHAERGNDQEKRIQGFSIGA